MHQKASFSPFTVLWRTWQENMRTFLCFLIVFCCKLIVCGSHEAALLVIFERGIETSACDWPLLKRDRGRFPFIIHWLSIWLRHFKSPSILTCLLSTEPLMAQHSPSKTLKNMLHTTLGTLTLCYAGNLVILALSCTFI